MYWNKFILVFLLVSSQVFAQEVEEKKYYDYIQVELVNGAFHDSNLQDPDLTASHFGLNLGEVTFKELLNEFNYAPNNLSHMLGLEVRINGISYLVQDFVNRRLEQRVNEMGDEMNPDPTNDFRDEVGNQIEGQINELIQSGTTNIGELTNEETQLLVDAITDQVVEETTDAANNIISFDITETERERILAQLKDRVEDIRDIVAFQNVIFRFSGVLGGEGKALVFLRGGRMTVDGSGLMTTDQSTLLEESKMTKGYTQHALQASLTNAAHFGFVKEMSHNVKVRADVFLFHNRMPFVNLENALANYGVMDDEEYETQIHEDNIDSHLARIIINSDYIDAYYAQGDYNGRKADGAGIILKLPETGTSFHYDTYQGERLFLDTGHVYGVNQEFVLPFQNNSWKVNVFAGKEKLKGSMQRQWDFEGDVDTEETFYGVGINKDINWFQDRVYGEVGLKYEKYEIDFTKHSQYAPDKLEGFRAGSYIKLYLGKRKR